ncbi:MAG: hypothetical protein ACT7A5_15980 [Ferrovibrionaceae bacterium]
MEPISAIIAAVTAAPRLFEAARSVYEAVTGKPSTASTPAALQAEVTALPPEAQASWAERMRGAIDMHEAETRRLQVEQGEVTPELLKALPRKVAGQVAWYRMTTRPRIALAMARVMLIPLYVMAIDGAFLLLQWLVGLFGVKIIVPALAEVLFAAGSVYGDLYEAALWPATAILITYMTLRAAERMSGKDGDGPSISAVLQGAAGAVTQVRSIFGRRAVK